MEGITAHVIADTLIDGVRVLTFESRFPRFILPEVNTHRVFSRNSASSRARSIKRTFVEVMQDPFIPSPFTRNMRGMSGKPISPELQASCEEAWLKARDCAVMSALDLLVGKEKRANLIGDDVTQYEQVIDAYDMEADSPSIHKQHVNRLLEPFMFHTAIITATEWDNFFNLRIAPDAQPEIYELAVKMDEARQASTPCTRDYHLPYIDQKLSDDQVEAFHIKRSVASCASISYKAPDELNDGAVERIFTTMHAEKHLSPFEHIACAPGKLPELIELMGWNNIEVSDQTDLSGNFRSGVIQLRKVLELIER